MKMNYTAFFIERYFSCLKKSKKQNCSFPPSDRPHGDRKTKSPTAVPEVILLNAKCILSMPRMASRKMHRRMWYFSDTFPIFLNAIKYRDTSRRCIQQSLPTMPPQQGCTSPSPLEADGWNEQL